MNKEMHRQLSAYAGTDMLVSIYSDTDEPDSFTLGYLLEIDNDNILLNMIDSFGEENGFCIINLDDIFVFDGDKMYAEKMQKLFLIKKQKREYIEDKNGSPMLDFLKYACENRLLIEVNEDDNYMGRIVSFSDDTLVLDLTDHYGNDMGTAVMDMNNINILKCQNRYLKDLELLYNKL